MPIINAQIVTGRTLEQKRAFMRALAQAAVTTLGAPEGSVRVILSEVDPEHWGIGLQSKAERDGGTG